MSAPSASVVLEVEGPFDLEATLGRYAINGPEPSARWIDGAAWAALRTPDGLAAIRYRMQGEERVEASAYGPGATAAIEQARAHLGLDDASWRFESEHPVVGPLLRGVAGLRFGRTGRVFDRLVPVILGQKVTSDGARRSYRELLMRYGDPAPGPQRLWVAPSAERVKTLPYYEFHPLGVERRRAETILFVARRAKRLDALADRAPHEAQDALLKLPGIGPWTAALVTSTVHGDVDAVPVGDYHMPNHVVHALTGRPRGTDAEMLELLEPFRPFRARALAAVLLGTRGAPKYGPRMSVRDIRGM